MWRIGIDEAGYGPNLGPLVMSAVACRTPDDQADADTWKLLRPVVGKANVKKKRLCVDDSKKVYQSGKGLTGLERTVHAFLQCADVLWDGSPTCPVPSRADDASPLDGSETRPTRNAATLGDLIGRLHVETALLDDLWFRGHTALPCSATTDEIADDASHLRGALESASISWGPMYCMVIDTPQFNGIVDRWGSKGAALSVAFVKLIRACLAHEPIEDAVAVVDKHGGRNFYSAMLQEICPDGWVVPLDEGMSSVYEIRWPGRKARVTFRPEADATSFEVALASIVSKYVRELCMEEFNAFWKTHVADVAPTAGYPGDASRFLREIRPALDRLNLAMDRVWRKR